jgi:4-carboxymuconolactone decarboxylase
MARLPYVDPATAPKPVSDALERVPPLNIFRMAANAETAFRPWLAFGAALLSSLQLDARVRELAILRVARLSDAEYEWVQHVPIALAVGASEQQVAAVDRGALDDGSLDELDRAVLRFTTEVVRDVSASDEAFAAVSQRLSPREVVELLMVIGQYMLVARLAATAGIELDEPAEPGVVESSLRGARPIRPRRPGLVSNA